jgi:hypothetical protein
MIGYTAQELKALDKADEAFAEIRKVADEFARQTNTVYSRTVNTWFSTSEFNNDWCKPFCWNSVSNLYDGWCNEAYECANEIEGKWNTLVANLRHKVTYAFEHDYDVDVIYAAHHTLREEIGRIVECWYDSASEVAYEEYLAATCEVA